jgi:hypothetical protein
MLARASGSTLFDNGRLLVVRLASFAGTLAVVGAGLALPKSANARLFSVDAEELCSPNISSALDIV